MVLLVAVAAILGKPAAGVVRGAALGRHDDVVNSFREQQGGVAHRGGCSYGGGWSTEGGSLVKGRRSSGGWSWSCRRAARGQGKGRGTVGWPGDSRRCRVDGAVPSRPGRTVSALLWRLLEGTAWLTVTLESMMTLGTLGRWLSGA
jgi:hypothetical protein